jgi:hypothetical protein
MAKFVKGSKAAKNFMARLRAARKGAKKKKAPKKRKISGSKHTDIKSHNYKITIGAAGDYAKFEISTIKALAKLLKKPIKAVQKAVYDSKNLLDLISNSFDNKNTPLQTAKILKAHLVPKKEVKPLDAFVNLLTKKGKAQSSPGSKANFPMKLPATVTIGNLNIGPPANTPAIKLSQSNLNDSYYNLERWQKLLEQYKIDLKINKDIKWKKFYKNEIKTISNVIKTLKLYIKSMKKA